MKSALLVFTKVPIPGLVKTRLTQNTCLTELDSSKIAEAMLKDTIILASKTNVDKIHIGYFPEENVSKLNEIIDFMVVKHQLNKPIDLIIQSGLNFDQRFGSVVKQSFDKGMNYTVVIGADLPYLDPKIINLAVETLAIKIDEVPIIIGPSSGGGIYLLGITKDFKHNWFSDNQLFSNGLELSNFSSFCKAKELPLISLPPYGDIDIEEDLISLISYINILKNSEQTVGFNFPHYTDKVIKELGLFIIEKPDQTRRRKLAKKSDR